MKPRSKFKQVKWRVVVLIIGMAVMAACNGASLVGEPTPTIVPTENSAKEPTGELKGIQGGESTGTAPTEGTEPISTEVSEEVPAPEATDTPLPDAEIDRNYAPSSRVSLAASSPANFNIASGELQLVEFFAFW